MSLSDPGSGQMGGGTDRPLPTICPTGSGPPASSTTTAVHLCWCLSGVPSPSSRQAMGCVGVLPPPEDPKERQGAQGEGPCPCPPECQEPAAIPAPQAVSTQGAWDHGCPHCRPYGCPHGCPQGGGRSPGVAVCPLSSHPCHPWGVCVWLLRLGGLMKLSWVMPPRAGTATIGVTSSFGLQIKRFLKEDLEEAELTQLLRDCPPTDSPRKVETPESRREPGHPLSGMGRVPPDEATDERDTRIFSRSRPLDFQQHITAPPPPSPNRPRSPWGQLDPYDSSEVKMRPQGGRDMGQGAAGVTVEDAPPI